MSYPFDDKENEFNKITREQLDSMSVAKLLELLERINETMTEDNFDDELVEACLDAIDRKSPMPEYPSTNESLKAFEAKLHTAGGTEPELMVRRPRHRFARLGLIAAIVAVCLFSGMIAVQAAGIDVFGAITSWTENLFGFGDIEDSMAAEHSSKSAVAVTDLEYIESWLPTLGEEFSKSEPIVMNDEQPGTLYYSLTFALEDDTLVFDAFLRGEDSQNSLYEKDGNNVKEITTDKATFYIFENNGNSIAAWSINGIEFSLVSSLSTEELELIIIESYGGN